MNDDDNQMLEENDGSMSHIEPPIKNRLINKGKQARKKNFKKCG